MGSSGVQREKVFPEPGQGSVYQAKVKGPPGGGGRLSRRLGSNRRLLPGRCPLGKADPSWNAEDPPPRCS